MYIFYRNTGRKYFTNWTIKINGEIYDRFDIKGKEVLISFESKSVGDTIAWAPYAVDFANKHNCKVILSTFHNSWFKGLEEYKDIQIESYLLNLCSTEEEKNRIKSKIKDTNIKKYGVKHPLQSQIVQEKIRKTNKLY